MPFVLDVALPLLVILMMTVVGLELTPRDFTNVRRYPGTIAAVLLSQWVLLLLMAVALVRTLALPEVVAAGVILVAASPIAAITNFYALLARGDVALTVTLTAFSSLASIVTTPIIASVGFALLIDTAGGIELPVTKVLQQLLLGLVAPILGGMVVRRLAPGWVARRRKLLQRLSLLALALLVGFVIVDQLGLIRAQLGPLVATSLVFTLALLACGALLIRALARSSSCRGVFFGFPARNMAVATLVAVSALGRADIASFAAVFFLVQVLLLAPLAMVMGRRTPEKLTAESLPDAPT